MKTLFLFLCLFSLSVSAQKKPVKKSVPKPVPVSYYGDKSIKTFFAASCVDTDVIKPQDKIGFATWEEAKSQGYKLGVCVLVDRKPANPKAARQSNAVSFADLLQSPGNYIFHGFFEVWGYLIRTTIYKTIVIKNI